MCFHSKQTASAVKLENRFDAKLAHSNMIVQSEHFSVFEKPSVPVIINSIPNKIMLFQWGLIPDKLAQTANARIETITDKFRNYTHQKCLVLVDGFYEKKKLFTLPDGEPFALAGLWSAQKSGESLIYTFTIITTQSKGLVSEYHKRMPVVLTKENERKWLTGEERAKLNSGLIISAV